MLITCLPAGLHFISGSTLFQGGDIIGLHNGAIEYSGNNVHDVVMEMMKAIVTDEDELITVYYGADTKQEDAEAITAEIQDTYGNCDVECHMGGQPLYYYLISVE